MTTISTKNPRISSFFTKLVLPKPDSHKGQNGKVLIIGGSRLFHAASLWSAEMLSHLVDMVHYCSTKENAALFQNLKKKFRNGIVVAKQHLLDYVREDDVILIGPGMVRSDNNLKIKILNLKFEEIIRIEDEAMYTYYLTKYLLENFPEKKFVIDAGALQMMDPSWLRKLKIPAIVTPHTKEFEKLFSESIHEKSVETKKTLVTKYARQNNAVILLKAVVDYVSDGTHTTIIEGGNAGLTKGGSGDVLAALAAGLYVKNSPADSAIFASYLLKKTADALFMSHGYWYNTRNLIESVPVELAKLTRLHI